MNKGMGVIMPDDEYTVLELREAMGCESQIDDDGKCVCPACSYVQPKTDRIVVTIQVSA